MPPHVRHPTVINLPICTRAHSLFWPLVPLLFQLLKIEPSHLLWRFSLILKEAGSSKGIVKQKDDGHAGIILLLKDPRTQDVLI